MRTTGLTTVYEGAHAWPIEATAIALILLFDAAAFHFMAVGQLFLVYPSRHTWMCPLSNSYLHMAVRALAEADSRFVWRQQGREGAAR